MSKSSEKKSKDNKESKFDKSKSESKQNKSKGKWKFIVPIFLILGFVIWASSSIMFPGNSGANLMDLTEGSSGSDSTLAQDTNFIKAVSDDGDSTEQVVRMSEPLNANYENGIDENAGQNIKRVYDGRRINIAIIGLDARIGTVSNHADANHILSIMPDSGIIELTSIPRDTPADAKMPDSSGQNKLTIVRAMRGREAYLKEAARIAGLDKIPYYVEVGFSQVMGILELLGYGDSKSALQVLRSRKGLGGDDYQRCYNQGQFVRQMLLRHFSKTTGTFGDLLVRGGLALVESNLTAAAANDIISTLEKKGFGDSPNDIVMRVRPAMGMKFKVYDFSDKNTVNGLQQKIEHYNKYSGDSASGTVNVSRRLWNVLNKAVADSAKNPRAVISKLEIYYNQRAWMQVQDKDDRAKIRDMFAVLLSNAYYKRKEAAKAQRVKEVIEREKELFAKPILN